MIHTFRWADNEGTRSLIFASEEYEMCGFVTEDEAFQKGYDAIDYGIGFEFEAITLNNASLEYGE